MKKMLMKKERKTKRETLCKEVKEKKSTSTKLFLVLVFFCLVILPSSNQCHSHSIEPLIEEFVLELNEKTTSSINFTNTSEEKEEFKIYTHRYNPEEEKVLDDRNFINLDTTTISLDSEETKNIEYEIAIPNDVIPGTYFSIIVIETIPQGDKPKTGGIGFNYGIGSLIAIHVIDDVEISEIFLNETQAKLSYKKPLNPFDTIIRYSIQNNSKYTFLPTGQITIVSQNEKPIFHKINTEEERLYPNQTLEFEVEYQGSLKNLLENNIAFARIASQHSNDLKETQIDLPYLTQTLRLTTAILSFLIILTVLIVLTKKNENKRLKRIFKEKITKKN